MTTFRSVLRSRQGLKFAGLLSFAFLAVSAFWAPLPTVQAAGCDKTSIVYCGLNQSSVQTQIDSLRAAYNSNSDGNGHGGVQTALNWAGYSPTLIASMNTQNTKSGTLYTDGRVVVDGRVVNDASQQTWITTRLSGTGRLSLGDGIYARLASTTQTANRPVIVTFDASGKAIAIVMSNCANSVKFVPIIPPAPSCSSLSAPVLKDKARLLYDFTANANLDGATLTGGSFNFGDGSTGAGTVSGSTLTAQHSYTKADTYTITATLNFSYWGRSVSKTCQTTLRVDIPAVSIEKKVDGVESKEVSLGQEFTYGLVVKNTGSQALTNVVVTDKAPTGVQFVKADLGKVTNGTGYSYTIPSLGVGASVSIAITAKATTYSDKAITNTACVNAPEVNPSEPAKDDDCDAAAITLPKPIFECSQLTGPLLDGKTMGYRFTAESKTANGAVLKKALFVFGDGQSRTVDASTGANTISTDYEYATPGKYSAFATLYFDVFGEEKAAAFNCYAKVEPSKPAVPECKPGIPVGDIRCNPCEYDASITKDNPRCVAPAATLPNTGAGNVIALASAALVGGFLWYRHVLFRRHKRAYIAADFGTAPLPLAEPLESPEPLAGTPLAEKAGRKLSLRRRRQF